MRVIGSMTTIPSRLDFVRPVLEAALGQTVAVDHVELNIPYLCIRMNEYYHIPPWLNHMDGVRVFRTKDYGPITKVAPTLLRHKSDRATHIWSIDDDCVLPSDHLELMCRARPTTTPRILARYGGFLNPDGSVRHAYGDIDVTMIEGFGGVLYPPSCICDDFQDYIDITSANTHCRKNDDIVLAMYFNMHDVPKHIYNVPTDDTPYMVSGWLPHSRHDALHETGHSENYRKIYAFIKTLKGFDRDASGIEGDRR